MKKKFKIKNILKHYNLINNFFLYFFFDKKN